MGVGAVSGATLDIAGIGYATIESVPAYHFTPGSIVARVVLSGDYGRFYECTAFPVCEYSGSLASLPVRIERILARAKSWRASTLVIEGPEPLAGLREDQLESLLGIRKHGFRLGVRVQGFSLEAAERASQADLIVFDYLVEYASDPGVRVTARRSLDIILDSKAWVEVAAYIRRPEYASVAPLIDALEGTSVPLHLYIEDHAGGAALTRLKEQLEEVIEYLYIHNKPYEYLDTNCPRCRAPIALREEGVLRAIEVGENNTCWKCGYKIALVSPVNKRTPRVALLVARGGVAWYPPQGLAEAGLGSSYHT